MTPWSERFKNLKKSILKFGEIKVGNSKQYAGAPVKCFGTVYLVDLPLLLFLIEIDRCFYLRLESIRLLLRQNCANTDRRNFKLSRLRLDVNVATVSLFLYNFTIRSCFRRSHFYTNITLPSILRFRKIKHSSQA